MTFICKKTNGSAKDIFRSRSALKLLNFKKSTVKDQLEYLQPPHQCVGREVDQFEKRPRCWSCEVANHFWGLEDLRF